MHKVLKCTIKKFRQTNSNIHFALLQIRSIPVSAELPRPDMMLFNRPIRAPLQQIHREPIDVNNDNECYEALKSRQEACYKNNDTQKDSILFFS